MATEFELPEEFVGQMADLTGHHIEGIAVMANMPFACPLISHVEGNLWQGGTPSDAAGGRLPDYFRFALNLYPWGSYKTTRTQEVRVVKLYDSNALPDVALLEDLAAWVNSARAQGPTLVHCQAGLNRSALVTALALIRAGRTADEAIALLREKRSPAVLCNYVFERWLRTQ